MLKAKLRVGMILKSSLAIDSNLPYYLILSLDKRGFYALQSQNPNHFWIPHIIDATNHGHHCWWDVRYLHELNENSNKRR